MEPGGVDDIQQSTASRGTEVAEVLVGDAIRTGGLLLGQATEVVLQFLHVELQAAGAALACARLAASESSSSVTFLFAARSSLASRTCRET